jgi:hypothetical protein
MNTQQRYKHHRKIANFLTKPRIDLSWFVEPELLFAHNHVHTNPKIGVALFGPKSFDTTRHKTEIHIGFVGEAESIEHVKRKPIRTENDTGGSAWVVFDEIRRL